MKQLLLILSFLFCSVNLVFSATPTPAIKPTPLPSISQGTSPNNNTKPTPAPSKDMINQYLSTGKTVGLTQSAENAAVPKFPSVWGPFFFLVLVGLSLYYGVKYIRKRLFNEKVKNNPVDFIRTIANVPINATASIAIVEIAEKYFLFGLTTNNMQMLYEIEDKEVIYKIKNIPLNMPNPKSFREVIGSLFSSGDKKKIDTDISKTNLTDFIKKQKDRLDNMK